MKQIFLLHKMDGWVHVCEAYHGNNCTRMYCREDGKQCDAWGNVLLENLGFWQIC